MTLLKHVRFSLLLGVYGRLLTPKQRELASLYYDQDLSLGEIAEQEGVSRQAVHDLIRRVSEQLVAYDEQLALSGKIERLRRIAAELRLLGVRDGDAQRLEALASELETMFDDI